MKDHAQFGEDLAQSVLGTLDEQARQELEVHLGTCGECRRELAALRADLALVAMSATGPQPPQRSRQRLMDAITASSNPEQKAKAMSVPRRGWPRWFTLAPVAAALVLAFVCGSLLVQVQRLKQELADEQQKAEQANEVVAMLKDPGAERMVLVAATRTPPRIKTIYVKQKGHVLLLADSLDPIPEDKVFQLWLLPAGGGHPMNCGTFNTDSRGNSLTILKMENGGIDAKAFAVTVEPAGGSKTPTMPIVYAPAG
jgi:anti-sigma-K factor RskA